MSVGSLLWYLKWPKHAGLKTYKKTRQILLFQHKNRHFYFSRKQETGPVFPVQIKSFQRNISFTAQIKVSWGSCTYKKMGDEIRVI